MSDKGNKMRSESYWLDTAPDFTGAQAGAVEGLTLIHK